MNKVIEKAKSYWWLISLIGILFTWFFTAKNTVLSAESTARVIPIIQKDIVELQKCSEVQKEKNRQFEDAIIQSRNMFQEIRADIRAIRK